jgi:predicted ATP-binding protein involved in virulence
MGAEQSTTSSVDAVSAEKARVSGQALDATINAVAAQVFDNVHGQLGEMQKEQVKTTEEMAAKLKSSLDVHASEVIDSSICRTEMDSLVACLKKNQQNPLACQSLVESFSSCSMKSS